MLKREKKGADMQMSKLEEEEDDDDDELKTQCAEKDVRAFQVLLNAHTHTMLSRMIE